MCDPVSALVGVAGFLGGKKVLKSLIKPPELPQLPSATQEQQQAKDEATKRANSNLAESRRRKRAARGLLGLVDDEARLGTSGQLGL